MEIEKGIGSKGTARLGMETLTFHDQNISKPALDGE